MRATAIQAPAGGMVRAWIADNEWTRFRGLLGRHSLPADEGLLLTRCSSVHSCFMAFPIDVVYLDREFQVVKVVRDLQTWRASIGGRKARHVLELTAGGAVRLGIGPGDQLTPELKTLTS